MTTENSYFECFKCFKKARRYFSNIFTMEDILTMVENPSTSEITTFNQIDHNIFKEFLAKSIVWDFYEMSKEDYLK